MKVCVVGAGPSGLTTIKQLLDEGHEVACFEKGPSVGGIWHRHEGDAGTMKAYDELILTISMKLMAFSDFIPEGKRRFADRAGYQQYLEEYADHYGLRGHITFGAAVKDIQKEEDGRWRVEVAVDGGAPAQHWFGAVAVCTGPFNNPNRAVEHLEKYSGPVLHSAHYRNNQEFRGKRVVVVGLAESGADIVRQISDVSAECTLALRSRPILLPRLNYGTFPTDQTTIRAHAYELYVRSMPSRFCFRAFCGDNAFTRLLFLSAVTSIRLLEMAYKLVAGFLGKGRRGPRPETNSMGEPFLPRKLDFGAADTPEHMRIIREWNVKAAGPEGNWTPKGIFCKNVSFIPNIASGKVSVNDSGISDIRGNVIHFADGTFREADAIVLCTGFLKDFSWLKGIRVAENNIRNLYKHAFPPEHGGRVALIGFIRPLTGGIPLCAEMQARYFAMLCSDKIALPKDVRQRIEDEKEWEATMTSWSARHFESVPSQCLYLDSIAKEIGCLMPMWKAFLRPRLLLKMWYYPFNQASYRLVGPHSMYEKSVAELMREELITPLWGLDLPFWLPLPHFVHPRWV